MLNLETLQGLVRQHSLSAPKEGQQVSQELSPTLQTRHHNQDTAFRDPEEEL